MSLWLVNLYRFLLFSDGTASPVSMFYFASCGLRSLAWPSWAAGTKVVSLPKDPCKGANCSSALWKWKTLWMMNPIRPLQINNVSFMFPVPSVDDDLKGPTISIPETTSHRLSRWMWCHHFSPLRQAATVTTLGLTTPYHAAAELENDNSQDISESTWSCFIWFMMFMCNNCLAANVIFQKP